MKMILPSERNCSHPTITINAWFLDIIGHAPQIIVWPGLMSCVENAPVVLTLVKKKANRRLSNKKISCLLSASLTAEKTRHLVHPLLNT